MQLAGWRGAASATGHCLAGCATGEIIGVGAGAAFGWSNPATIIVAFVLAFAFGYAFTAVPLVRGGMAVAAALGIALAADTVSVLVMEVVDNVVIVFVPGALDAQLDELLFWWSLVLALALAFLAAWPVNRWLIARGRGHAVAHRHHHGGGGH